MLELPTFCGATVGNFKGRSVEAGIGAMREEKAEDHEDEVDLDEEKEHAHLHRM